MFIPVWLILAVTHLVAFLMGGYATVNFGLWLANRGEREEGSQEEHGPSDDRGER